MISLLLTPSAGGRCPSQMTEAVWICAQSARTVAAAAKPLSSSRILVTDGPGTKALGSVHGVRPSHLLLTSLRCLDVACKHSLLVLMSPE